MLFWRVGAAAALATFVISGAAPAQQPAREERARHLVAEAKTHYAARRCSEAAALLVEANRLHPEPTLLFNLGLAQECAGDRAAAARAYREFLDAAQPGETRASAQRRLADLERGIAEDERRARELQALEEARRRAEDSARRAEESLRARAATPQPHSPSPWPFVVGGTGVLGIGAGVVLGLVSSSRDDASRAEPNVTRSRDLHDEAAAMATGANVAFVAGGALLAAGVVWAIVDLSRSAPATGTRRSQGAAR